MEYAYGHARASSHRVADRDSARLDYCANRHPRSDVTRISVLAGLFSPAAPSHDGLDSAVRPGVRSDQQVAHSFAFC